MTRKQKRGRTVRRRSMFARFNLWKNWTRNRANSGPGVSSRRDGVCTVIFRRKRIRFGPLGIERQSEHRCNTELRGTAKVRMRVGREPLTSVYSHVSVGTITLLSFEVRESCSRVKSSRSKNRNGTGTPSAGNVLRRKIREKTTLFF